MGWEVRHETRQYVYRNHRVNGRPVKTYLGADDRFGFGHLMAHDLERLQRREAKVRKLQREARDWFRGRIDELLKKTATANVGLRVVAEGVLYTLGYHKHHRGEWRMRRQMNQLADLIRGLKADAGKPAVIIRYDAPADDAEAVQLYEKARAGDGAAQEEVRRLIVSRGWVDWIGDLGRQATRQLIHMVGGGDPVWTAGITEKANALRRELLGPNPSVLDELLARRVVNCWIATHALELELTVRPPLNRTDKEHLDKALGRAQKRFAEAVRELARVRRLQAPVILARLTTDGPAPILPPPPGTTPAGTA